PVDVAVLAGLDRGTGGSADRIAAERVHEDRPLVGDPVEIRSGSHLLERTAVCRHGILGMVVGKDEHDVRTLRRHQGGREQAQDERNSHGGARYVRRKPILQAKPRDKALGWWAIDSASGASSESVSLIVSHSDFLRSGRSTSRTTS